MKKFLSITDAIQLAKVQGGELSAPVLVDKMPPMKFVCNFSSSGASEQELAQLPCLCPSDLLEFWHISSTARLFEDNTYGQWGLEIYTPTESLRATEQFFAARKKETRLGDLLIGRFLGDSDTLILRCDPSASDFRHVLVALPLDSRNEWYRVAESFTEFVDKFVRSAGKKFWV